MTHLLEDDLQAFVDDVLDEARRGEVEAYLAQRPEEAARLHAYRAQDAALRALFDPVLAEPVPAALAARPAARRWRPVALAASVLFAGVAIGWIARGSVAPLPQFLVVLILVAMALALLNTETISLVLGKNSGVWGVLAASLVGAVTLIPGFVAFPAAAALMQGGAGATQIAAFVSSLMMVGVVTLPLEIQFFGKRAAFLRNILAYVFSLIAAVFVGWMVQS